MAKHIQLTIAEPCHEDWDGMSPTEKGRFCDSCQKQVVDFTGMNDAQLATFFKKETTGSVCGRFYNDQLGKDINIPKKRIPWVKYFFQLTLPLFLASLKSNAQKGKVAVTRPETETVCTVTAGMVMPQIVQDEPKVSRKEIRGLILTEDGKPVSYASIMIKGTTKGAAADNTGLFTLGLSDTKEMVLEITSVGFENKEVAITKKDIRSREVINIQLKPKTELSEVIVMSYGTTKGRIMVGGAVSVISGKTIVDTVATIKETVSSSPKLFLYPNPVKTGTTLNISIDKMEEGYYSFQLLNISGHLISQQEVWIDKEARLFNMPLPSVAAGAYFITMINKKSGKKTSEKFIIH